jgi:hypothetical protein
VPQPGRGTMGYSVEGHAMWSKAMQVMRWLCNWGTDSVRRERNGREVFGIPSAAALAPIEVVTEESPMNEARTGLKLSCRKFR